MGATAPTASNMRLSQAAFWRTWFIREGYLWEWLTAAAIVIINHTVPLYAIPPMARFYVNSDPTLSYPVTSSTISGSVLYILAFLFPGVVIVCTAALLRSFHDGHHGLLCLLESFALASGWKRWMNIVGVYRPSWLTVLAQGDAAEILDARQSYPSGHAAYSFCGCVVLTLYLLGKFKVLSQPSQAQFLIAVTCLVPVMLCTFIAVTRVHDYEHAPADINAGCFIGFVSAVFAYLLNYPLPTSANSSQPKARAWTTRGMDAVHVQGCTQAPQQSGDGRRECHTPDSTSC